MQRGEAQYLPYAAGRKSGGFSDVNRLNMRVGGHCSLPAQSRLKEMFSLQNLEFNCLWFSPKELFIELERLHDRDTFNPVVGDYSEN